MTGVQTCALPILSIDGPTSLSFSEDVAARFKAYGWQTIKVDGHDRNAVDRAIRKAKRVKDKPSLILAKTLIGYGSPNKENTAGAHGAPLGADEVLLAKKKLGYPLEPEFFVANAVRKLFTKRGRTLKSHRRKWEKQIGRAHV